MSELYTVRMVRKHIVSTYDGKGRLVAERTEELPLVFHDLPAATANSYQSNFPDAKVEIIKQDAPASSQTFSDYLKKPRNSRHDDVPLTDDAPPTAPKRDRADKTGAAMSGDMTAAINAEIKERS